MDFNFEQNPKAKLPTYEQLGKSIYGNSQQQKNAAEPIYKQFGKEIDGNIEQYWNAELLIVIHLDKLTDFNHKPL